ncbi:MAG: aromatic hydrocarbon degradation protein, partial [Gammaproteobacteria bacterium]
MRKQSPRRVISFSLAVLLFQFSQSVLAAGLYISEIASPASVGTAGVANVVNNVEASSAFTNPAGMTG